jgi:FkbM family methyltransferase
MLAHTVISLLCPTRGRPDQAIRLALSVLATAAQPRRVELLFYVDADDPEKPKYIEEFKQHNLSLNQLMRCLLLIGEPIGISKSWNELAARCQGDLLIMAADDQTYSDRGWDDRLDQEVKKFPDQIFCMWFNDGHWGEKLCTFPIVSRKWCLTLGYFTTGIFECLYDDLWIMDLAKRIDRLHYIPDVLTEHFHWSYGKAAIDTTYQWKQVSQEGQLKPAVHRDMNLFGRTLYYRETDAKRLLAVMEKPIDLKPGMAKIGKSSIFEDSTLQSSEAIKTPALSPQKSVSPPVIEPDQNSQIHQQAKTVTLYLPGNSRSFKINLEPETFTQKLMLDSFSQGQFYQPEVSQLLMEVLKPGDCFIDIGAHIGYFSLLAALLVGDRGTVFSIEMESKNYTKLSENIQLNQFKHLKTFNVALGSEAKSTEFFFNLDNDGGHALWNVGVHAFNLKSRVSPTLRLTRMETLDRVLGQQSMRSPKLIKIETEGSEYETLQGSLRTIQSYQVPYIVCEINRFNLQMMETDEKAIRSLMTSLGYEAYLLQPISPRLIKLQPSQSSESSSVFRILFARP